jgi:thiol-disulfide isomerase/thioredoxin
MNGVTLKPTMYKGSKNVILVFWSPSCPHCRRELPKIRRFMATYGEKYDATVITLVFKRDKNTEGEVRGAMGDLTVDFPTALFSDTALAGKYNANSVPTLYVINKNGIVVEYLRGEIDKTQGVLKSIFDDSERMNKK